MIPAATIWRTRNRSALAQPAIYTQIAMTHIATERDLAVPMRDGTRLFANLYGPTVVGHIPSGPASGPVIHIEDVTRFYKVYDAARRQPEYLPGVTPSAALKQRLR